MIEVKLVKYNTVENGRGTTPHSLVKSIVEHGYYRVNARMSIWSHASWEVAISFEQWRRYVSKADWRVRQ